MWNFRQCYLNTIQILLTAMIPQLVISVYINPYISTEIPYEISVAICSHQADCPLHTDTECLCWCVAIPGPPTPSFLALKRYPFSLIFFRKITPYLTKKRTFVVRKIKPFFRFQGEHIAWWPLLKQIEDIHYSYNIYFSYDFPIVFF